MYMNMSMRIVIDDCHSRVDDALAGGCCKLHGAANERTRYSLNTACDCWRNKILKEDERLLQEDESGRPISYEARIMHNIASAVERGVRPPSEVLQ